MKTLYILPKESCFQQAVIAFLREIPMVRRMNTYVVENKLVYDNDYYSQFTDTLDKIDDLGIAFEKGWKAAKK